MRKLCASYNEFGLKIGHVTVYLDGAIAARLANHDSADIEIDENEHDVRIKVGFLPIFKGKVEPGTHDWLLSFEQSGTNVRNAGIGKWILHEYKPLYGGRLK